MAKPEILPRLPITFDESNRFLYQSDTTSKGFKQINVYRQRGIRCDMFIKVADKCIQAHRLVLAATIPYFEVMCEYADVTDSNCQTITLNDLNAEAIERLIDFVYTGQVEINDHNVQNLLVCADFLQMNHVRDVCADYLIMSLNPENVIGIRQLGKLVSSESIVAEADYILSNKFVQVIEGTEFLELGFEELCHILSYPDLKIPSEEAIFDAVLLWVKHDVPARRDLLAKVLETVRFSVLTSEYVQKRFDTDELLRGIPFDRKLLNIVKDAAVREHVFNGKVYILKTGRNVRENPPMLIYNPLNQEFVQGKPLRTKRDLFNVVVFDGNLYAIGGYCDNIHLGTMEMYSPSTNSWSPLEPMQTKRWFVGVAPLNGKIYVCGGWNASVSFDTVECYCPITNTWTYVASMLKQRSTFGVLAVGKFLYAIGGCSEESTSVEKYDPETNVWTEAPPLLFGRHGPAMTVVNGKMYVAGGYNMGDLNSFEMFDPKQGVWTHLQPMNSERNRFPLVAIQGRIWAFGGDYKNTIEVYDPETNTWEMNGDMPLVGEDFVAGAIE